MCVIITKTKEKNMGLFNFFKKKKQTEEVDIHLLQQKVYQDIFSKIQEFLPTDWQKVDFHMYHTSRFFGIKYFVLTKENEWVDCFKILDENVETELFLSIDDDVAVVWNQLPKKQKWYVLNMIIDNQGYINVSYDYADGVQNDDLFMYLHNKEKQWEKKFIP